MQNVFARASVCAKMGNGTWSVEIIPAEIQPPPRTPTSASGNRIRIGTDTVTNWGDSADLVVAFNEQVLLQRHRLNALTKGAMVLLDDQWEKHDDPDIRKEWKDAMDDRLSMSPEFLSVVEIYAPEPPPLGVPISVIFSTPLTDERITSDALKHLLSIRNMTGLL